MGNFKGHALPGSFFLIAGLWWTVKSSLWHTTRRNKSTVPLASRAVQRRLEVIEAAVILAFALIGESQGPQGPPNNIEPASGCIERKWGFVKSCDSDIIQVLYRLRADLQCFPLSSDPHIFQILKCTVRLIFFHSKFLFLYHLHGRDMLDVHVHQLLLYAIFGGALTTFLEVFQRGNILLELLRASLSLLQGSWFWQIGFVLYPPSGLAEWDLKDHNNMMFITMCYCWHFAFALVTVAVVYSTVCWVTRSRLRQTPPLEMGLLKTAERELESEDEMKSSRKHR
uniref:Transmembrane protein 45a n=1 Tax=Lepisosteus oculatus TaxID=7918 RepID=W5MX84_LEPOC